MSSSPLSEPAIIEQVITEFFAKSLHIILESRSPYVSSRNYFHSSPSTSSSTSSSSTHKPRDKWFNLALRDCPAALENFDLWRQSNIEPLVVDVILIRRHPKNNPSLEYKTEKIVERWIVQYEKDLSMNDPVLYKKMYKRSIILLRSLYVTVRLLPAYKVFKDIDSSGRIHSFSLSHKISSFVEPFTVSGEDEEMKRFCFVPVDTPCGRLSLSVTYVGVLESVESEASTPISAQVIPDYVGSPLTDPLKRLASLPSGGSLPTYLNRRHSWSNEYQGVTPSVSPLPSPAYSDSRALRYNRNASLPPRSHPPDNSNSPSTCRASHNVSLEDKKNCTSLDEYWPSPPFSPSSSPSPPTHLHGSQLQNDLLRSESAPVGISLHRLGSGRLGNQALPPSASPKSGRLARAITTSIPQTSPPENKLQVKKGSGEFQIGTSLQKMLYSARDEIGNISGQKISSCSSPRIPSRSSSRFSFLDEYDDEFACPFAVDDVDLKEPCRIEASDSHISANSASGELIPVNSIEAAIGSLVQLLKTAAPLQRDFSDPVTTLQADKEQGTKKLSNPASSSVTAASELCKSRTAADALEELKSYRETKELLLMGTGSQSLDSRSAENPASEGSL